MRPPLTLIGWLICLAGAGHAQAPQDAHQHHHAAPAAAESPSAPTAQPTTAPRARPGSDILWLTDLAPQHGNGHGGMGMSMAEMMGDGRKPPTRSLWLRQGSSPVRSASVQATGPLYVLDAAQQAVELQPEVAPASPPPAAPMSVAAKPASPWSSAAQGRAGASAALPLPVPGYYNVGYVQRAVNADVLLVQTAKTVLTRPAGHGARDNDIAPQPRNDARLPLEIVREAVAYEGMHTRLNYGDHLVYQVLLKGKPLAGALLTLTTGQGWKNTVTTDVQGKAEFTLIRDYFEDDWLSFDRSHREPLVVAAVWEQDEAGALEGASYSRARYVGTLSETYSPSVRDYKSYAWGLTISVIVALFVGSSIYLYRRRRVKPYREERFRD